ncbi:alanine-phosphoribitol ligase [Dactylosporangium fulvum]|uniref:FAD-binding oxidoreductase n=1 Tax=Dactylosporangium fulvum TaxID=53359 RepID=A0ABY5WE11_9ACTN|nr:styrene monooxygenase/indole monooxygenase family protein [Dactylosporangium fulvum]UWP86936.1 FAD-binding oxidoreductase [Dactylosporangium fulvum]
MRKVLIVGAGQCGLLLGHGLLLAGDYEVTILSARTPDEIRQARPTSTQVMFGPALAIERAYGLDLWADETPGIAGLHLTVAAPPGGDRLDIYGVLDAPAQSTDQRVKMAGLLELFEERGGTVHTMGVSTRDLDEIAESGRYDLIVVAAGRGELTALFDRDPSRSPYTTPQRGLAAAYVHGMHRDPHTSLWPNVTLTVVPGAGELILIPALTTTGPCDILFWEAIPDGPLDVFGDHPDPADHLARAVGLIREYTPWLYERCAQVELTDPRATLTGRYTPTVRRPIGELPSGGLVLGAADVVVANDPLVAQGANTAARCAAAYLDAILDHGDRPFDRAWMQHTFEQFWTASAQQVTAWANGMLRPPPEHVQRILGAAAQFPEVASRFANGFADPDDLVDWFMTPAATDHYLGQVVARATAPTRPGP